MPAAPGSGRTPPLTSMSMRRRRLPWLLRLLLAPAGARGAAAWTGRRRLRRPTTTGAAAAAAAWIGRSWLQRPFVSVCLGRYLVGVGVWEERWNKGTCLGLVRSLSDNVVSRAFGGGKFNRPRRPSRANRPTPPLPGTLNRPDLGRIDGAGAPGRTQGRSGSRLERAPTPNALELCLAVGELTCSSVRPRVDGCVVLGLALGRPTHRLDRRLNTRTIHTQV